MKRRQYTHAQNTSWHGLFRKSPCVEYCNKFQLKTLEIRTPHTTRAIPKPLLPVFTDGKDRKKSQGQKISLSFSKKNSGLLLTGLPGIANGSSLCPSRQEFLIPHMLTSLGNCASHFIFQHYRLLIPMEELWPSVSISIQWFIHPYKVQT